MLLTSHDLSGMRKNLKENFNQLIQTIDNMSYSLNISENFTNYTREQTAKMRHKFVNYLINGYDFYNAVELIKGDFPISQDIKFQYQVFQKKRLPQRIFLAVTLNKKGFKTKEIAGILDTTPATVRNYLKTTLDS